MTDVRVVVLLCAVMKVCDYVIAQRLEPLLGNTLSYLDRCFAGGVSKTQPRDIGHACALVLSKGMRDFGRGSVGQDPTLPRDV